MINRYIITILCNDSSEIKAKVIGENIEDVKARILTLDKVKEFICKGGGLCQIDIRKDYTKEIMPEYKLEPSQEQGKWVLTDLTHMVVFRWEDKRYNDTVKITPLNDDILSALDMATVMRQAGEWLMKNHPDKVEG